MRPLSELRAELRAELAGTPLRGIFSDIDDTLTHDGVVVTAAYDSIVRAAAAGFRVVLVTGRPAGWAEVLASVWPVDAAIAENGGIAYLKRGRRVERVYFNESEPAQDARRLVELRDEVMRTFPFARSADDSALRVTDIAFDVNENEHLSREQIEALTTHCRSRGARTLVSSVHAHACFHTADKALMSARVANILWGDSSDDVAANYAFIGDSPNDQAAFAFFAASIGVANVSKYLGDLNPPPRFVTPSHSGYGFAETIDVLVPRSSGT